MTSYSQTARPINQRHGNAIDVVSFAINFSRELEQFEIDRLYGLEVALKEELPIFSKLGGVRFQIDSNQGSPQLSTGPTQFRGVSMQKITDGRLEWLLEVRTDAITITCAQYDRWDSVIRKVSHFVDATLGFIDTSNLAVLAVTCQVVDKFVYDSTPEPYCLSDIFNQNSEYLTGHSKNLNGNRWHIHQGWFNSYTANSEAEVLNQLNLDCGIADNRNLVVSIGYVCQIRYKNTCAMEHLVNRNMADGDTTELRKAFDFAHDTNKIILRSLLSQQKLTQIGLAHE